MTFIHPAAATMRNQDSHTQETKLNSEALLEALLSFIHAGDCLSAREQ
jgi:hypothetical protein